LFDFGNYIDGLAFAVIIYKRYAMVTSRQCRKNNEIESYTVGKAKKSKKFLRVVKTCHWTTYCIFSWIFWN